MNVTGGGRMAQGDQILEEKAPQWYFRSSCLVIGFCCVGPLIMPLAWFNPALTARRKVFISVVMIALSVAIFFIMRFSVRSISDYYALLQELIET
jgi:hypothetical protein